jgi:hypothetical protein
VGVWVCESVYCKRQHQPAGNKVQVAPTPMLQHITTMDKAHYGYYGILWLATEPSLSTLSH